MAVAGALGKPARSASGGMRKALLETSLQLIAESGISGLTLREIGSRLGVSRMAPYRHFADKSAILAALTEIGFTRLGDALEAAMRSRKGHFGRLEEMAVAYVRFAHRYPAHFSIMFGPGNKPVIVDANARKAADRAFKVLLDAVWEAQRTGKLAGHDAPAVTSMLWATIHGISELGLEKDPQGEANFTRQCLQHWRKGLQA